ncbi:hypothetical protein PAPYR_3364 [Paratrimastix pyriformis]|uniref:Uncharacterized protein n=1 Tax=Paratrimastix pyriformis TaxID=342808 RepID=A0ABQ8UUE1_9EUKA|nr:hypothetical protein PAPYR_3364 [Paratrimastix pyriformis]
MARGKEKSGGGWGIFILVGLLFLFAYVATKTRTKLPPVPKKEGTIVTLVTSSICEVNPTIKRAISSWNELDSTTVMIMSRIPTILHYAGQFPQYHLRPRLKSMKGLPLLVPAFRTAEEFADSPFTLATSAELMFFGDLQATLRSLPRSRKLLLVGRRFEIDPAYLPKDIFPDPATVKQRDPAFTPDFARRPSDVHTWERTVEMTTYFRGKAVLAGPDQVDYLIWSKGTFDWDALPNFLLGRDFYMPALLSYCLNNNITVIDATKTITALRLRPSRPPIRHATKVDWNSKLAAERGWSSPATSTIAGAPLETRWAPLDPEVAPSQFRRAELEANALHKQDECGQPGRGCPFTPGNSHDGEEDQWEQEAPTTRPADGPLEVGPDGVVRFDGAPSPRRPSKQPPRATPPPRAGPGEDEDWVCDLADIWARQQRVLVAARAPTSVSRIDHPAPGNGKKLPRR